VNLGDRTDGRKRLTLLCGFRHGCICISLIAHR
jgi:hypothetical protein